MIQDTEDLTFTCNYTVEDYQKVNEYYDGNEYEWAVWLGGTETGSTVTADGTDGQFSFTGMLSVYVNGGGVNEVVDMTITLTPSTVIEFSVPSGNGGGNTGD